MLNKERYLLMFSGGSDSICTVEKLASQQDEVHLISFCVNNPVLPELIKKSVSILKQKFGANCVLYEGIYDISAWMNLVSSWWNDVPTVDYVKYYPHAEQSQINILHWHVAMWLLSISWCRVKGLRYLACGYRQGDITCTGMQFFLDRMIDTAAVYGINTAFPIWEARISRNRSLNTWDKLSCGNLQAGLISVPTAQISKGAYIEYSLYIQNILVPFMKDYIDICSGILSSAVSTKSEQEQYSVHSIPLTLNQR